MADATEEPNGAAPPEEESGRPRRRVAPALWVVVVAVLAAVAVAVALVLLQPRPTGAPSGDDPTSSATSTTPPDPEPSPEVEPEEVALDDEVEVVDDVTVSLGAFESVDGIAEGPGEVSGPSVRFTVTVRNATDAALDISTTVVTVDYGPDRTPALQLEKPGGRNLPTTAPAGGAVDGVYVFSIPVDARDVVRVTVDYAVGVAPVVFTGSAP